MANKFGDAPVQSGQGKLTIKFTQFFYLVSFSRTASASNFKGAVVLLPSINHTAEVALTPPSNPDLKGELHQKQVDVFTTDDNGNPVPLSRSGLKTSATGKQFLPTTDDLFDVPLPIQPGLLRDKPVSRELNVRFVLADGKLREQEAKCPQAANVDWKFHRPGEPVKTRKLTDRLDYELDLKQGQRYWIVVSNGRAIESTHPLANGDNALEVLNRDHAKYHFDGILHSYSELHDAVLVIRAPGSGEMRGPDPGCVVMRGAAEPICGGEQGDPDPPQDPPDPPSP